MPKDEQKRRIGRVFLEYKKLKQVVRPRYAKCLQYRYGTIVMDFETQTAVKWFLKNEYEGLKDYFKALTEMGCEVRINLNL